MTNQNAAPEAVAKLVLDPMKGREIIDFNFEVMVRAGTGTHPLYLDSAGTIARLEARVAELSDRLEIDRVYVNGERVKPPEDMRVPDGIECRDDTIKLLQERAAYFTDRNRVLTEALSLWRSLVTEGGVPRYTIVPGAALNTVVTHTDRLLRKIAALHPTQPKEPNDV